MNVNEQRGNECSGIWVAVGVCARRSMPGIPPGTYPDRALRLPSP